MTHSHGGTPPAHRSERVKQIFGNAHETKRSLNSVTVSSMTPLWGCEDEETRACPGFPSVPHRPRSGLHRRSSLESLRSAQWSQKRHSTTLCLNSSVPRPFTMSQPCRRTISRDSTEATTSPTFSTQTATRWAMAALAVRPLVAAKDGETFYRNEHGCQRWSRRCDHPMKLQHRPAYAVPVLELEASDSRSIIRY